MIRKNVVGLSPTFDLLINDVGVNYTSLNRLVIDLSENKHDALTISMAGIPPRAVTDYQNQAVRLHIDTGANYSFDFVGYITDVQPESKSYQSLINNSPFQQAQLVCLGASYGMRGTKSKVWSDYALSDVAKEMATTYGFSVDAPDDILTYSPFVQSQESDWQFLVRYANLLGYSVNVHGTHLHIYDPHKASDRAISFHKLITVRNQAQGSALSIPGQISEFKGSFSQHHPDGVYKGTTVTVRQGNVEFDVTSQELKGVSGTPQFSNRVNQHVNSYERAERVIDAIAKPLYDYQATAVVAGLAGCVPGGVVQLDNYNSNFDGLWYVREVSHSLSSGAFISTLQLARNRINQLTAFNNTDRFALPPGSRLIGGHWEATKKVQRVYS